MLGFFWFLLFSFEIFHSSRFRYSVRSLLLFGLAQPLQSIVVLDHISQRGASALVIEVALPVQCRLGTKAECVRTQVRYPNTPDMPVVRPHGFRQTLHPQVHFCTKARMTSSITATTTRRGASRKTKTRKHTRLATRRATAIEIVVFVGAPPAETVSRAATAVSVHTVEAPFVCQSYTSMCNSCIPTASWACTTQWPPIFFVFNSSRSPLARQVFGATIASSTGRRYLCPASGMRPCCAPPL